MALSNTAPSESRGLTKRKGGSPTRSSLTGVTASDSVEPQDSRLGASTQRTLMNLELQQFPKAPVREGAKEATTHDFLSLYKNAAVTGKIETAAAQGIVPPSVTQEFLQPLEKCTQPASGNIITPGLLNSKGHMNHYRGANTSCYGGVQGASYVQSNGVRELPPKSMWMDGVEGALNGVKEALWSTNQLKFGSLDHGYVAKTGSTYSHLEVGQHHTSSLNKQWQQLGSEFCNIVKEPYRVTSKCNKDEEYSECNNQSEKKDVLIRKADILQKMDIKTSDCKASTPRSKHSATEQRRRSKINDRFQMLRQLVPNTDQKRDKASFLLEVIDYIQVLQEKLRKYDASEHGRQQERLKTITWDLPQRNSGLQEFMPIVSTVPFDLKKATDNILGRSRSTSVAAPGEHGSIGDVSLPVDAAIEDSQFGNPNHEKVSITKSSPVSLSTQLPVHIPFGKGLNLANTSVLQSVPESHMSSHFRLDDEKVVPLSINKVEAALPVPYENNRPPARCIYDIDGKLHDELKDKEHDFSWQDANGEAWNEDLENGKGNSGLELEPSVAGSSLGLLPNKDACVSSHRGGVNNAITHRPESPQKGETSTSFQELMIVQGDDVNVSTLYSQKLRDMLTRELQCSGLDLSKTSISVQINLGKAANQTGEIRQQSEGNGKHPASQELEHFSKRPKIESKS